MFYVPHLAGPPNSQCQVQLQVVADHASRDRHGNLHRLARWLLFRRTGVSRPPPDSPGSRRHLLRYVDLLPLPISAQTCLTQRLIVPTDVKDRDTFHLTIEEYLLSLTDLTGELCRLATNAVTLGDFELPMTISAFIKDLFAGFQLLNLKNDILRKRADAVKYDVKRVEDVVYDLSLRGLVARPGADAEMKSA